MIIPTPDTPAYIEMLREVVSSEASWVLFHHGTAVFLSDCEGDLAQAATEVLREYGPVQVGSPAGDFAVIEFDEGLGWGVTFDHPDLLALVVPSEIGAQPEEVVIGVMGRTKRSDDAENLQIAHIEDRRNS